MKRHPHIPYLGHLDYHIPTTKFDRSSFIATSLLFWGLSYWFLPNASNNPSSKVTCYINLAPALAIKDKGYSDNFPSINSLMTSWLFFDNPDYMGMVLFSFVYVVKNLEDYTLFWICRKDIMLPSLFIPSHTISLHPHLSPQNIFFLLYFPFFLFGIYNNKYQLF